MIIEKFNLKAQESIESACRLAVEKDHSVVTPWHLLSTLLEVKNSIGRQYLEQTSIDLVKLTELVNAQLGLQPRAARNAQQTPINRDLERLFIYAEKSALSIGDKYIGINHLLLSFWELEELGLVLNEVGGSKETLLNVFGNMIRSGYTSTENTGQFEYLNKYTRDLTAVSYTHLRAHET
jgi:ATP-dependent Clp protease ATP-binding subunit ClpB